MANFLYDQLELLLSTAAGVVGGVFGWMAGKRKNKAETFTIELENVRTILDINRSELDSLKKRIDFTQEELHNCRKEMEQVLTERLNALKKQGMNGKQN